MLQRLALKQRVAMKFAVTEYETSGHLRFVQPQYVAETLNRSETFE